jgi:hypothetical protein
LGNFDLIYNMPIHPYLKPKFQGET